MSSRTALIQTSPALSLKFLNRPDFLLLRWSRNRRVEKKTPHSTAQRSTAQHSTPWPQCARTQRSASLRLLQRGGRETSIARLPPARGTPRLVCSQFTMPAGQAYDVVPRWPAVPSFRIMLHMCVNFGERAGETESHFRCTVMLGRGDGIAQLPEVLLSSSMRAWSCAGAPGMMGAVL